MTILNHHKPSRFTRNHFLVIVLAMLIGIQVIINNRIATTGEELEKLAVQSQLLSQENQKLITANMQSMSLTQLAEKAVELGYLEPNEIINLKQQESSDLALKK